MSQQRLNRSNQDNIDKTLYAIDGNFDDLFDVMQILDAAYTLTSQTGIQAMLNGSTNGALLLQLGLYEFESEFSLSAMSASSGTFGFDPVGAGTAVLDSQAWSAEAAKFATSAATALAPHSTFNVAANTALTDADTNTVAWARIRGILRVSTVGTIIPSVSLGVAAAAVVGKNSFFRLKKLSTNYKQAVIQPPQPNFSKLSWS